MKKHPPNLRSHIHWNLLSANVTRSQTLFTCHVALVAFGFSPFTPTDLAEKPALEIGQYIHWQWNDTPKDWHGNWKETLKETKTSTTPTFASRVIWKNNGVFDAKDSSVLLKHTKHFLRCLQVANYFLRSWNDKHSKGWEFHLVSPTMKSMDHLLVAMRLKTILYNCSSAVQGWVGRNKQKNFGSISWHHCDIYTWVLQKVLHSREFTSGFHEGSKPLQIPSWKWIDLKTHKGSRSLDATSKPPRSPQHTGVSLIEMEWPSDL